MLIYLGWRLLRGPLALLYSPKCQEAVGYLIEHFVLDPAYFAEWGSGGGAMYGAIRPFWQCVAEDLVEPSRDDYCAATQATR